MPIRPPPLKLKYDNRFPLPIPSARKPPVKESFFAKLYKANWRNAIVAVAGFNALRFIYKTYNAWSDLEIDASANATKLAMVSIALCVMYAVATLIELFGAIGIATRRFAFVRAYTFLAFVSATLATAASVLKTTSFFVNAEELMYECVALALSGRGYSKSQFRGKMWPGSFLAVGLMQARRECVEAWTQQSWSQIVGVFVFGFMPSMISYLIVYTYYRQTTDASHPAYMIANQTVPRASSSRRQRNNGYSRVASDAPYAGSAEGETNSRAANAGQRSARLRVNAAASNRAGANGDAGRTAAAPTAAHTTRGLNRPNRPPALKELEPPIFTPQRGILMQSAAALSSLLSPGPPTYGVNPVNQNRLGAIALSCSGGSLRSARYDKFV
ncbi:capsular associated protein [Coprinopsis cinerea AmutBmut pab1-1]|nr:capsular associated protein [Coprinopsis cinerea AmutBmut pab1-1]